VPVFWVDMGSARNCTALSQHTLSPYRCVTRIGAQSVALSCCHARDSETMGYQERWIGAGRMKQASQRHAEHDFGVVLMLTAVAGAISQLVDTGIAIGRAAGWWP
jgi:hypothetical protein